jgi:hypothetical protein
MGVQYIRLGKMEIHQYPRLSPSGLDIEHRLRTPPATRKEPRLRQELNLYSPSDVYSPVMVPSFSCVLDIQA